MVQEIEYAPEDYIAQVLDDTTDIDDPQNDIGEILNTEDSTSDSVYDKTTVDHDTNNANDENAEAMVDITNAKEKFDDCYGIIISQFNLRARKEREYSHLHLHEQQVIEPCNAEKMSEPEKLDALEYLMVLKKK